MPNPTIRYNVLIVDSSEEEHKAAKAALKDYTPVFASTLDEAIDAIITNRGVFIHACLIGLSKNIPQGERLAILAFKNEISFVAILAEVGSSESSSLEKMFGHEIFRIDAMGEILMLYVPSKDWFGAIDTLLPLEPAQTEKE